MVAFKIVMNPGIKSFKRYLNNRDESDEMLNSVKNDILLMLYNNRKSVSIVE